MSFTAGRLYLVVVHCNRLSAAAPTGITSASNTFVKIKDVNWDIVGSATRNLSAWRALGVSTVSEAISIAFGTATDQAVWHVIEVASGFDTTGSNGSGAVGDSQTGASETNATSGSMAALTLQDTQSVVVSGWSHRAAEATTPKTGWTELADNNIGSTSCLESQYNLNDASPTASWATSRHWAGVGVEIKATGANVTVNATAAAATGAVPSSGGIPEVDVDLTYTIPD